MYTSENNGVRGPIPPYNLRTSLQSHPVPHTTCSSSITGLKETHLATNLDSLSKQSICIGVVEVLGTREPRVRGWAC